ncbi:MAG: hypothetical protein KGJ62_10895 [Armatimonadetes bacterium]|nr:hypothetical protein [Armatimonadota bacterium]MDE2207684.1 hypothetical protein [Armatimonadota bacterium]
MAHSPGGHHRNARSFKADGNIIPRGGGIAGRLTETPAVGYDSLQMPEPNRFVNASSELWQPAPAAMPGDLGHEVPKL